METWEIIKELLLRADKSLDIDEINFCYLEIITYLDNDRHDLLESKFGFKTNAKENKK